MTRPERGARIDPEQVPTTLKAPATQPGQPGPLTRACHAQGGHVRTHGWGKHQTRLCVSPDGRLVDIQ